MKDPDVPSIPAPGSGRRAAWLLAPVLLGALLLVQTWLARESTSATYDEPTYLHLGLRIYRHGDFASLDGPMVAPLPILLEYALPALGARSDPSSACWEWEEPELIRRARLATSVLVGVPLVLAVYAWLAARRGWPAGALGGGLMALSPSVVAFSSVATTDACFALAALAALAALHRYRMSPSPRSFATAGVGVGLAVSAKHTGAFLVPVALVLLVERAWRAGRATPGVVDRAASALWRAGTRTLGLVGIAFAVNWAAFGFASGPEFRAGQGRVKLPVLIPMLAGPYREAVIDRGSRLRPPLPIDTIVGQWNHARDGHPAFLMGERSRRGWWYFFPVALALKSTPAELALALMAASLALGGRGRSDPARRLWLTALGILAALAMTTGIDLGHRYVLVAYPLVILLAVDGLAEVGGSRPLRAAALGGLLLAGQAASAAAIAPHYLSYFNRLCGGPAQGYRYLVDSCLDWGQDLPALRAKLAALGSRKVALAFMGGTSPRAYGVRSVPWNDPVDPGAQGCDWVAISATELQGVYHDDDPFAPFRRLPAARAAYSMFLYDLRDPRVRAALAAARGSSPGNAAVLPRGAVGPEPK